MSVLRGDVVTLRPPDVDDLAALAAIRAYEKVGFRRVGVMRAYERGDDGTYHDNMLMDLLVGDLTD